MVLGTGLSGLSYAYRIKEKNPGLDVHIVEKLPYVGGLAASAPFGGGYFLDFGPHFLTVEKDETLRMIKSLLNTKLLKMDRHCLLYFNNRYLSYPPSPRNIIFELGLKTAFLSTFSYFKSKVFPPKEFKSFEDWSIYNFGEYLHKIFFKPYTENFWGIQSNELAAKWAETRISRMNLITAILGIFLKSVTETSLDRDKLPLHYPVGGIGDLAESFTDKLSEKGVKIDFNSDVKRIELIRNDEIEVTCGADGSERLFSSRNVISTLPITYLIDIIEPKPPKKVLSAASKLRFRSLIVMYLVTKKKDVLKAPYVYYHNRAYHRLTESSKISRKLCPKNENVIFVEKSCFADEDLWNYDKDQIFDMFMRDLEKDGILHRKDVIKTFLIKKEHVYPVYMHDFNINLQIVKDYLNGIRNLKTLGRPGEFLYLDMDQSIERSFAAADKLLEETGLRNKQSPDG